MKSGTIVISVGIISTARTRKNIVLRPGKFMRARAYPAIAPVARLTQVDADVTIVLFSIHRRTGFRITLV